MQQLSQQLPDSREHGAESGFGFYHRLGKQRARGGQELPRPVRQFMEGRFDADFGSIRVHNDDEAAALSRDARAHAFTVGQDIFFGRQEFAPGSIQGKRLLAHELAHTLQQKRGSGVPRIQLKRLADQHEDRLEREADAVAEGVVSETRDAGAADPCMVRPDYQRELKKVDTFRLTLKRWLKRVKRLDLRGDRLSRLRSRRARRVCLAAGCGDRDFQVDAEVRNKLACFDEAHRGGGLQGVCKERLGVECSTGPAPLAPWKRRAEANQVMANAGLRGSHPIGTRAEGLQAELIRAEFSLRNTLGEVRYLKADFSKHEHGEKFPSRSRNTQRYFADSFGEINSAKISDVEAILNATIGVLGAGDVVVREPTLEEQDWMNEIADENRPCLAKCLRISRPQLKRRALDLQSDAGRTLVLDCMTDDEICPRTEPGGATESEESDETPGRGDMNEGDSEVNAEATASGGEASPVAPDAAPSGVVVFWADPDNDARCAAAGGFHEGHEIGVCTKPGGTAAFDRARVQATLLHELFHEVLGESDVDVYANAALFPLLKELKAPVGPKESGSVKFGDVTLALRSPDSLTRFVLLAAQMESESLVARVKPAAESALGAGSSLTDCQVDTVQLAVGLAYQWLRWGELTLVSPNAAKSGGSAGFLENVKRMKATLGEAGKRGGVQQTTAASSVSNPNPKKKPPTLVAPPRLVVKIAETSVSISPSGNQLIASVPSKFLSDDYDAQVEQILGAMRATPALMVFLSSNREGYPDAKVLGRVSAPESCS